MKTKNYFILILSLCFFIIACEKEGEHNHNWPVEEYPEISSITEVNVQVQKNSFMEYGIDINNEYKYSVYKEAKNAESSCIVCIETLPEQYCYNYAPQKDFLGEDIVEILIEIPSDAASLNAVGSKHILRLLINVCEEVEVTNEIEMHVTLKDSTPYIYFLSWNFFLQEFVLEVEPSHAAHCEVAGSDSYPFERYFYYDPNSEFKGQDYAEVVSYFDGECATTPIPSKGTVWKKYKFTIDVE